MNYDFENFYSEMPYRKWRAQKYLIRALVFKDYPEAFKRVDDYQQNKYYTYLYGGVVFMLLVIFVLSIAPRPRADVNAFLHWLFG